MFLDFYGMREQPFGVTPDPRFLFLGESHREALASLFYGIEADRGFMALIAHPGLGKTTLTFQLLEKLHQTSRTVFLFQTQCNSRELFQYILSDLGVDASAMDMVSMYNKLNEILIRERLAGRRFVLAIDEAQNLEPAVLETIRLLSNYETSQTKLLQILLIGQPQLARKLADPGLVQLEQRIAVFARLEPFNSDETAHYIAHRLKFAGYDAKPLFTQEALRIIADRSRGVPRNINSLCFSALSIGCALGRKQIDAEIMREVVADLNVESLNILALTPPATHAPVTVDSVLSTRPKFNSRFRRWALKAVSVSVPAVSAFLIYSLDRIGQLWRSKTGASFTVSSPIKSSTANVGGGLTASPLPSTRPKFNSRFRRWALKAVSVSVPAVSAFLNYSLDRIGQLWRSKTGASFTVSSPIKSSTANVGGGLTASPLPSTLPNKDFETFDFVVQSGNTLDMIALQSLGQDSPELIEQIQRLNPALTDPDHIEPGQEIRLPKLSNPVRTSSPGGTNDMTAKN